MLGLLGGACTPSPPGFEPPPLPEGAVLVHQGNGLSVYNVEPGELCEGDLRAIVQQFDDLVDYLGVKDPQARLILFDPETQNEALQEACTNPEPVGGCAPYPWLGAYATPYAAPHELVHVLVGQRTGRSVPPAILQEGIAHFLEGKRFVAYQDELAYSVADALSDIESHRLDAHVFTAWTVERDGLENYLRIYEELDAVSGTEQEEFATAFGFSSLDDLQAEFEATSALEYPSPWRLVLEPSSDEWAEGLDLTAGCAQPHTHRETGREWVRVIFEAPLSGRYRMVRSGINPSRFLSELEFLADEPRYEPLPDNFAPFEGWEGYACFELPGTYQFNIEQEIGDATPAFMALEWEGGAGCE